MESTEVIKEKKAKVINADDSSKKKGARFVVEFSKEDSELIDTFNVFIEKCNNKEVGRKVTWTDVIKYLVLANNNDKIIKEVQESVLTIEDKVNIKLRELNGKDGNNLTIIELAAKALKIQ